MKQFDPGQTINTLANLGVIAGIVFLVLELGQNNEFLELEARAVQTQIRLDGWNQIVDDPELADLMIKDRNGGDLSEAEEFRMQAYWMAYFIRTQWRFENDAGSDDYPTQLRRLYAAYGSMRRSWEGTSDGARGAGKFNFSPEFVQMIDEVLAASDNPADDTE